jgi:hypothetical protein
MVEYMRMYDAIQFCVNWGCVAMTEVTAKETCVRQDCSLNSYIVNIFVGDIKDCIGVGNTFPLIGDKPTVVGILFTDDLGIDCFKVTSSTYEFRLDCSLRKLKLRVLKK